VTFQKLFEFTQPIYEKYWIEIKFNLNWFEFDLIQNFNWIKFDSIKPDSIKIQLNWTQHFSLLNLGGLMFKLHAMSFNFFIQLELNFLHNQLTFAIISLLLVMWSNSQNQSYALLKN
jgi:hypothetical protein